MSALPNCRARRTRRGLWCRPRGHRQRERPRPAHQPAYADLQAPRIARERGRTLEAVRTLIREHTDGRALGFLGRPGVDVLELDLALDGR
jgi:hypothetical protein